MYDWVAATLRRKQEQALKHPTRRAIVDLLRGGRELPSAVICQELTGELSLGCVVYHLSVLREAGLVEREDECSARVFGLPA